MTTSLLPTSRFFPLEQVYLPRELQNAWTDLATSINARESGIYSLDATPCGQSYYGLTGNTSSRSVLRKVFSLTSIANGVNSIAHSINITPTTQFTRIFGAANRPSTSFVPLPYVNVATPADGIALAINATNILVTTTTGNWTAYSASIVVEYIPN